MYPYNPSPGTTVAPMGNWWPYSVSGGSWPKPNQNNLLKVQGPESAKAYQLGPNSTVVLFDANDPIFYLKATDDGGFATLRTFEFSERPPETIDVKPVESGYAGKDELEEIKKQLSDISEALKGLV